MQSTRTITGEARLDKFGGGGDVHIHVRIPIV